MDQKAWRLTVITVTVAVLAIAGSVYLYKTKDKPLDTSALNASFKHLTGWLAEHRGRLNQKIVKVKQIATNNAEQPIHYEFYSELPKMKVPIPDKKPN